MSHPVSTVERPLGKDPDTPAAGLLAPVVTLFFLWGGLTSLNDVLIPKLKGLFALSFAEAMLTQFAFFMAYFLVSLPAGHLIARMGYLSGIVSGLATMAAGCMLFVPAAASGSYTAFLVALFVLAAGITVLQVAANPLIANLGTVATSHGRLTLAQAFNALGTTLFPPVGAWLILGSIADVDPATLPAAERSAFLAGEASIIGSAYLGIAAVLLAVAAYFWLRRASLPAGQGDASNLAGAFTLLRRPRLAGGVLSIFLYVGAEVSIGSMLVNYLSQERVLGLTEQKAGGLIALYWGGAMVGRFIGAWLLQRLRPGAVLASFCLAAALLAGISASSGGAVAGYTLLAVGLMNSIQFPAIFSLGVEGLGRQASQGSGLLCMAIVGGALVPVLFGVVADATSLSGALIVPMLCYLCIAAYGWSARRPA